MQIPQLVDLFVDHLRTERGASEATVTAYRSTLARLVGFLGREGETPDFEDVTTAVLRRFAASLKAAGAANSSVARHVHAIRSFWRFVVETYDLGTNASLPLRAPKPDHRIPAVLSLDECQALIDACERNHYRVYRVRDRVLVKLMCVVGLRRSEVIALRVCDYDRPGRAITVAMSKGRKSRLVPIPGDLAADIDAWLQARPVANHDRLLTTRTGKGLSTKCLHRTLERLAEEAGLADRHITPHGLRHTAATLVLRNSGDLVATSRMLGHSSVAVTGDVYCHLTTDDVRRAVGAHPLAGLDRRTSAPVVGGTADDARLPEDAREVVHAAERRASEGLAAFRDWVATDRARAEHHRRQCVLEVVRNYVRPQEAVARSVVETVLVRGGVVDGFTMAEHLRITNLHGVLAHLSDLAAAAGSWGELLSDVAGRLTGTRNGGLSPAQAKRIDDVERGLRQMDPDAEPETAWFAHALARVARADLPPVDGLFLAQLAANVAWARRGLPLVFAGAFELSLLQRCIDAYSSLDSSLLRLFVAGHVSGLCEEAIGCDG
ncbi:MAG: tyrosine-type recombinase/integrase [Acidobacteriota bacterium]|nr:tyrosine-type recombinase/integrase [Acidobacteriota bacterium]